MNNLNSREAPVRIRQNLWRFIFPITAFVVHGACVVLFSLNKPPLMDPESEMTWLPFFIMDLPASLVFMPEPREGASELFGLSILIIFGGLQWSFWAWLVQVIVLRIARLFRSR